MFLRNSDDPQHLSCPCPMMAMRSPRRSASSMKWVVRTTTRPLRLFLINPQVNLDISVQSTQSVGTYYSTIYSDSRDITVQYVQSVGVLQYKVYI